MRKILELRWSSAWFPKGLDDPKLALIEIEAEAHSIGTPPAAACATFGRWRRPTSPGSSRDMGENVEVELHGRSDGLESKSAAAVAAALFRHLTSDQAVA